MNIFGDKKNASHRVSIKLVCKTNDAILLIRAKGKETFNLVGGAVDIGENIKDTIYREFLEETGNILGDKETKLLYVENKIFPVGGQFDSVINIFYELYFDKPFDIILEEGVYEESKWVSKEELKNMIVSNHSKKELLLSLL